MLTQDEARKTICPHLQPDVIVGTVNDLERVDSVWEYKKCIAALCSQWRWITQNQHGAGAQLDRDGALTWVEVRGGKMTHIPPDTARGLCGLAPLQSR